MTTIPALVDKFWESIPSSWRRTRSTIRGTAVQRLNLTVEQFQVLRRIRKGIASVSAIADDSRTSRSAVSKAVDVLVNKGLVVRHQDLNDRRNIPLALTEEGQRAIAVIYDEAEAWLSSRFERLTEAERSALLVGLDLLHKAFAED